MQLLKSASGAYVAGITHPGYVDTFSRPNGPVGGPWDDAHDVNSARWDQATITDGNLVCTPSHLNEDLDAGTIQDYLLGLWLITMDIGLSDNFEVGVELHRTVNANVACQVDVAAFVDPEETSPVEDVGICATQELVGTYFNRLSHPPSAGLSQMPEWQNDGNPLGGSSGGISAGAHGYSAIPGRQQWSIRAVGGSVRKYQNGVALGASMDVPAWAEGRTRVGLQVLGLSQQVGEASDWGDVTPVPSVYPVTVTKWWWRPFTGSL